jgi:hypothetical protein
MAISKFTPQSAKKDTGRTIGDNEVAKLAHLNRMVDQVNNEFANFNPGGGGLGTLDIVANGTIGGPTTVSYSIISNIPATIPGGSVNAPVIAIPSINLSDGSSYGGNSFTATSLEFSTLGSSAGFAVYDTSTLQVLSAPLLTTVINNSLNFNRNSALTTVNFPSLISAQGISFGETPLLTTVNFPLLQICYQIQISNPNPGITGFRQSMFPALRKSAFNWGGSSLPSFEIDFPLLTDLLASFNGGSSSNINRINLPALVNLASYVQVTNISTLTEVTLGTVGVTKTWGNASSSTYIGFQNCALNQASVDRILTVLASLDGTNGTTISSNGSLYLQGGSNASPSSTGSAAISVLQGRGWTVNTN